jgi:hypothetical protein
MPACFQLYRKSDETKTPINLPTIDDEICAHFGVEPDLVRYYMEWFGIIGFDIACTDYPSFAKTKAKLEQRKLEARSHDIYYTKLIAVCDFLEENFVPRSFYQAK